LYALKKLSPTNPVPDAGTQIRVRQRRYGNGDSAIEGLPDEQKQATTTKNGIYDPQAIVSRRLYS
jgi:hypothetical protein